MREKTNVNEVGMSPNDRPLESHTQVHDAVLADLLKEHPLPKVKSGVHAAGLYRNYKPVPAPLR